MVIGIKFWLLYSLQIYKNAPLQCTEIGITTPLGRLGVKRGGALIGVGTVIGEFTVDHFLNDPNIFY